MGVLERSHIRFDSRNAAVYPASRKRSRAALIPAAEISLYASVHGERDAGTPRTERTLQKLLSVI